MSKKFLLKKILNDTASCQDSVEEGESSETSLIYKPSQNKWMKPKQTEVSDTSDSKCSTE